MTNMLTIRVPGEIRGKGRGSPMKASDADVAAAYAKVGSVAAAGRLLGLCGQSVHERLVRLGINKASNRFTEAEAGILRAKYATAADAGRLCDLAAELGRTVPFICRQAKALGMTDKRRSRAYVAEPQRLRQLDWLEGHDHPRGMAGKRHAPAVGEAVGAATKARFKGMTATERSAHALKGMVTKVERGLPVSPRPGASWKAGWREVGGQRCYFRSRWEANYGRYLEWLRVQGEIARWEHEPETFWFKGIKRGAVSYLPDFRVTEATGAIAYHEVKGWMDARSKTKIRRMAKYHPRVRLIVIDAKAFKRLSGQVARLVPEWEDWS